MRIAIFLSSWGQLRGGLETIATHFAGGLARRGHQLVCVAGASSRASLPDDLAALPVTWLRVPALPPRPAPLLVRLGPAASRRSRALSLKAQSLSFLVGCYLRPSIRRLLAGADVTLSFLEIETVLLSHWRLRHGRPHLSYFPGVIDWRWLRRDRSTMRLAISHTLAGAYREVPGFQLDGVVTPGVESNWLQQPYEVRAQAERLFFAGRLESNKGGWTLLRVFSQLAPALPELQLRLAGDGPLRRELEQWTQAAGLAERVYFLGALAHEQVRAELGAADLFLFPTRYESFGLALLEAQAAGAPVLCSDLPIMMEAAGGAACLLPPGDERAWVTAIRQLVSDQPARARLSAAGRQNARRFTWEQTVAKLESHLTAAQGRSRRPAPK